jgi:hypothetical protein
MIQVSSFRILTTLPTFALTVGLWLGLHGICLAEPPPDREEFWEEDPYFESWLRGDDLAVLDPANLGLPPAPLPSWDLSATVAAGVGYRDNVMLSAFNPSGGAFLLGGFELSFLRLPTEGVQFSFFLEGEHLQFVTGNDLPSDTFISAYSQLSFPLPEKVTLGVGLIGFHLDQMVDLATADLPLEPIRMRGYGITPNTFARKDWPNRLFLSASLSASRQIFEEPLHNYWEYGPKMTLGISPAHREFSMSLEYLNRSYDDRRALSAQGASLPDTDVAFQILRPEIQARFTWGEDHQWQSRTQLGMEFNRDNETDYFAYDRIRILQQLGFRHQGWDLQGRLRYSFHDYKVQQIPNSSANRTRHAWGLGLEARRRLLEKLDLSIRYDWEKVFSDEAETDYEVNTVSARLQWHW